MFGVEAQASSNSITLIPSTSTEGSDVEFSVTDTAGELATATSVEAFDNGVSIGTAADPQNPEFTIADVTPGVHPITIKIDGGAAIGPENLTVSAAVPSLTAPATSTVSIGTTVNFTCTTGFAAQTTKVEYYVNSVLVATGSVSTGDTWPASWDTTGQSDAANLATVSRRYYSGATTGTVDSVDNVLLTLQTVASRHLVVKTFLATDAAFPIPADIKNLAGTSGKMYGAGWGGGGGGLLATGGGGGGACSEEPAITVTPGGTIAVTIGAGGSTLGTDGGTTSIGSACVALGGFGRAAGGGNAGKGGAAASGTGTTKTSGGDGTAGAGTVAGGASGGTSTSGSGATPGAPNGALGGTGNAHPPGSGGLSQAGAGFAGARGEAQLWGSVPATSGYSRILGVTSGRDTTNATTRNITIPPGSGGKLGLYVGVDGNPTVSATGWTALTPVSQSTNVTAALLYRDANGSDPVALDTSASESLIWICVRYESSTGGAPSAPEWSTTSASGTNPDPPSHSPTGGSAKCIFGTFVVQDAANAAHTPSAYPTNHTDWCLAIAASNTAGVNVVLTHRLNEAASENPGAYTSNSNPYCVATFSIRPT